MSVFPEPHGRGPPGRIQGKYIFYIYDPKLWRRDPVLQRHDSRALQFEKARPRGEQPKARVTIPSDLAAHRSTIAGGQTEHDNGPDTESHPRT